VSAGAEVEPAGPGRRGAGRFCPIAGTTLVGRDGRGALAAMARLIVEAIGTGATGAALGDPSVDIAMPGNSRPLAIVVSVTDSDGAPVTTLAAPNFTVGQKLVAPYGADVELAPAYGVLGGYDGYYWLRVVPVSYLGTQYSWMAGRYVFAVAITAGADQGQTMCAVLLK
jgi:hypothetical protein